MRLILSPAKKMRVDTDSFPCLGLPRFLPRTRKILAALRALSPKELQSLWKCSDRIAAQNVERLKTMDLEGSLTPAVMAYVGIQYQYLAPGVLSQGELDYLQEHLRILSGFYGLLRPFDGVAPYRLEMGARLSVAGKRDLYAYWGDTLAQALWAESDTVVNLASQEYSRCITAHPKPGTRLITCVFGEVRQGKVVEKGTLCKMARGEMVRCLAQQGARDPEAMQSLTPLGYRFQPDRSDETTYVFCKEA